MDFKHYARFWKCSCAAMMAALGAAVADDDRVFESEADIYPETGLVAVGDQFSASLWAG